MRKKADEARLDLLFETLSDRRRRALLIHMHSSDSDLFTVEGLARALCEADDGVGSEDARRERIEIQLYHRHLPKLDDSGYVEFDARTRDVRYRETTHDLIDTVLAGPGFERILN